MSRVFLAFPEMHLVGSEDGLLWVNQERKCGDEGWVDQGERGQGMNTNNTHTQESVVRENTLSTFYGATLTNLSFTQPKFQIGVQPPPILGGVVLNQKSRYTDLANFARPMELLLKGLLTNGVTQKIKRGLFTH